MKTYAIPSTVLCSFLCAAPLFAQGSLTPPPGVPAPVMKTLTQVEPRTPISSLPYTINQPGSYYLTGNLASSTHGIFITTSGVSLDLMGFELVGGASDGIRAYSGLENLTVRNGTVRGWEFGIDFSSCLNCRVEDIRASGNGFCGISPGISSVTIRCVATGNSNYGISSHGSASIIQCIASKNSKGIYSSDNCLIQDCIADDNSKTGIQTSVRSIVRNCLASRNQLVGIKADDGSSIIGCFVGSTTGTGIEVKTDCLVQGNNCDSGSWGIGTGAGILVTGDGNRIEGNTMSDYTLGLDIDGTANLVIRNSAHANTTNYSIVANNKVAPIVVAPNSPAINGNTGGAGIGSTDPAANIAY